MYFFQRPFKKDIIILKCHRESETKLKIQLGSDLNEFFKIKSLLRQNRGLWPWTSLSAQNFHSHINLAEKYSLLGRLVLKSKTIESYFYKNGPITASFCLFSSFSHYKFNKHRWCAIQTRDSYYGRRRRYHGALVTA